MTAEAVAGNEDVSVQRGPSLPAAVAPLRGRSQALQEAKTKRAEAGHSALPTERIFGGPIKMLTRENAFITETTVKALIDPAHLNAGILQDIYEEREDDFAEPQALEVWYDKDGERVKETMFVEPLSGSHLETPRIIVSVKAVKAMHRAIAVLTRKLDNVLLVLRSCRHHYYKELTHLRELVSREEHSLVNYEDPLAKHYAVFFNAGSYQDEVTVELFRERLLEATGDLQEQLRMKQREIQKLHTRIYEVEKGLDRYDPSTMLMSLQNRMPLDIILMAIRTQDPDKFGHAVEKVLKRPVRELRPDEDLFETHSSDGDRDDIDIASSVSLEKTFADAESQTDAPVEDEKKQAAKYPSFMDEMINELEETLEEKEQKIHMLEVELGSASQEVSWARLEKEKVRTKCTHAEAKLAEAQNLLEVERQLRSSQLQQLKVAGADGRNMANIAESLRLTMEEQMDYERAQWKTESEHLKKQIQQLEEQLEQFGKASPISSQKFGSGVFSDATRPPSSPGAPLQSQRASVRRLGLSEGSSDTNDAGNMSSHIVELQVSSGPSAALQRLSHSDSDTQGDSLARAREEREARQRRRREAEERRQAEAKDAADRAKTRASRLSSRGGTTQSDADTGLQFDGAEGEGRAADTDLKELDEATAERLAELPETLRESAARTLLRMLTEDELKHLARNLEPPLARALTASLLGDFEGRLGSPSFAHWTPTGDVGRFSRTSSAARDADSTPSRRGRATPSSSKALSRERSMEFARNDAKGGGGIARNSSAARIRVQRSRSGLDGHPEQDQDASAVVEQMRRSEHERLALNRISQGIDLEQLIDERRYRDGLADKPGTASTMAPSGSPSERAGTANSQHFPAGSTTPSGGKHYTSREGQVDSPDNDCDDSDDSTNADFDTIGGGSPRAPRTSAVVAQLVGSGWSREPRRKSDTLGVHTGIGVADIPDLERRWEAHDGESFSLRKNPAPADTLSIPAHEPFTQRVKDAAMELLGAGWALLDHKNRVLRGSEGKLVVLSMKVVDLDRDVLGPMLSPVAGTRILTTGPQSSPARRAPCTERGTQTVLAVQPVGALSGRTGRFAMLPGVLLGTGEVQSPKPIGRRLARSKTLDDSVIAKAQATADEIADSALRAELQEELVTMCYEVVSMYQPSFRKLQRQKALAEEADKASSGRVTISRDAPLELAIDTKTFAGMEPVRSRASVSRAGRASQGGREDGSGPRWLGAKLAAKGKLKRFMDLEFAEEGEVLGTKMAGKPQLESHQTSLTLSTAASAECSVMSLAASDLNQPFGEEDGVQLPEGTAAGRLQIHGRTGFVQTRSSGTGLPQLEMERTLALSPIPEPNREGAGSRASAMTPNDIIAAARASSTTPLDEDGESAESLLQRGRKWFKAQGIKGEARRSSSERIESLAQIALGKNLLQASKKATPRRTALQSRSSAAQPQVPCAPEAHWHPRTARGGFTDLPLGPRLSRRP